MRVHLVQLDIQWENPAANRERVSRLLEGASIRPGDLILLPEMFDTGFSFNTDATADRTGESRRFIESVAREARSYVVAGITAIENNSPRNRALVADPAGNVIATYDKRRLLPLGSPSEADCLTPGDAPAVFDWSTQVPGSESLRVAPVICYDLRFPELFADGLRRGATAFALIASWPEIRAAHWRALAIARAIECQAFVFAANRSGKDPNLAYAGGSIVVDPQGRVLLEAGAEEGVFSVQVDPQAGAEWRSRFPAWKTRSQKV